MYTQDPCLTFHFLLQVKENVASSTSVSTDIPENVIIIKPEVNLKYEPETCKENQSARKAASESIQHVLATAETLTPRSVSQRDTHQSTAKERCTDNCTTSEELKCNDNIIIESPKKENEWQCSIEQVWSMSSGSVSELTMGSHQLQANCFSNSHALSTSVQPVQSTSVFFQPRIITATPRDISLTLPQSPVWSLASVVPAGRLCPCCKEGAPPCPSRRPKQSTGTQYENEPSKIFWQVGDTETSDTPSDFGDKCMK